MRNVKITSPYILRYFANKYKAKFNKNYISTPLIKDLAIIKRLSTKYTPYLVLEAIDLFFESTPIDKASVGYFSACKLFEEGYPMLSIIEPILKYKHLFNYYSPELQPKVQGLIFEFFDYATALSLEDTEIQRKKEIIKELEEIDAAARLGARAD